MKIFRWVITTSFVLSLTIFSFQGCAKKRSATSAPSKPSVPPEIIRGELIFQTHDLLTLEEVKKNIGVEKVEKIDEFQNIYRIRSDQMSGREEEFISRLLKLGKMEWVEPNYQVRAFGEVPRDPKWLSLWGLKNYGQDAPGGSEGEIGADIGALGAWDLSKGSHETIVAVIDTGIDYTHPDLKANMWINEAEKSGIPGIDDDGNGFTDDVYGWDFTSDVRDSLYHGQPGDPDPIDDHGHGTHVSGTIGALGNNGVGVTGINWNVRLMALKFLNSGGSGTTLDEYRALRYAIDQKVDVINASYGGGGRSKLIETALREAGEKGILMVVAAGNAVTDNDFQPSYPANYELPNLIAVAATDNRDQIASFSNFGFKSVHIAAPGVGITSTYPIALAASGGEGGLPYQSWSGTSMATPHVVGAAALVLSIAPELRKNPEKLKERLLNAVDWKPQLASKVSSGGRLNLLRALRGEINDHQKQNALWIEEAIHLTTPKNPTEKLDQVWTIHKAEAKAIRLHVKSAVIDFGFDLAVLFDSQFKPISFIPPMTVDEWMPVVIGNTLYLKFSNAMVAIQKFVGEKKFNDLTEVDWALATFCTQNVGETVWTCMMYDKPGPAFANFNSDGVVIDRIAYLPK